MGIDKSLLWVIELTLLGIRGRHGVDLVCLKLLNFFCCSICNIMFLFLR